MKTIIIIFFYILIELIQFVFNFDIQQEQFEMRWKINSKNIDFIKKNNNNITSNYGMHYYKDVFSFFLNDKNYNHMGHRSELSYVFHRKILNRQYQYKFKTFIPSGFPKTEVSDACRFCQWHDTRDLGEVNRTPPLAMRIISDNGNFLQLRGHYSLEKIQLNKNSKKSAFRKMIPFVYDRWMNFIVHTNFSISDDGFVKIWKDNKLVINYKGPIGYNDDLGIYFKIGIYCLHPKENYNIFHKNILISPM